MTTRESLIQRPDIPDEEVDDIVSIAARLQDDDTAGPSASVEDIEAVAAELSIDPRYVEQAVEQWRDNKAQKAQLKITQERNQKLLTFGTLAVVLAGVVVSILGGLIGAGSIHTAHNEMVLAEQQLDVVLERSAALAPQLAALGGGDAEALAAMAQDVEDGDDIEARLDAAKALGIALSKQLNDGSPYSSEQAQIVLNLSHEVTGTWNRISTETRRYRAAEAAYDQAATEPLGAMAVALGLAP